MKVLLLGDLNSSHLQKWIKALSDRDIQTYVFTLSEKNKLNYNTNEKVFYSELKWKYKNASNKEGSFLKLLSLNSLPELRKILKSYKPDIIHAHYASSYGFLAALLNYHPYFVSFWGSDIFSFPRKRIINKAVIKLVLNRADVILSSSRIMASELSLYTDKAVSVIPFGVDTSLFRNLKKPSSVDQIVIGTIKMLEDTYGIDILVRVFKVLKDRNKTSNLKLLLVGDGSMKDKLKKMVQDLQLTDCVTFTGFVNHSEVTGYHNRIDIFANLSRQESFGVSVLEASSCEVPVIASDRGGLVEVTVNQVTGFSVPLEDENKIIEKFQILIDDAEKRKNMGISGRQFVLDNYDWEICVDKMITLYKNTLA